MEHWLNPRVLFALMIFATWAVRAVKAARDRAAAARGAAPPVRGPHGEPVDPEAEERQRRVRAEVARKIAERKILMMPSAEFAPPPLRVPAPELLPEEIEPAPPPPALPAATVAPVALTPAQSALAADFERWSTATGRAPASVALEDLRDPAAIRRAVLMREILGPPVGLRQP